MDGNKDEALKCLQIGKDALGLGDRTRALKFITKAQRLDPSLPVDDLLSTLENTNDSKKSSQTSAGDGDSSNVRRRVPVPGSPPGSNSASCTEEQVKLVREIRRKKDYYDILGLEKTSTVEDVRKAYRKLSLKVHPDKNKAPGSEEAFKKVSKAFQCLSVEENRKQYDLVGSDEPGYETQTTRRRANQGFNNGFYYNQEVDAEEIFRNFFYGGMNPRSTTQFNFGNFGNTRTGENGFNIRALFQFVPVILILIFSFMSSNDPIYSLQRTYTYDHRLTTPKGVDFYVESRNFEQNYPFNSHERSQIEGKIEHEYLSNLYYNCRAEKQRLLWGYQLGTPNCDMLTKFDSSLVA